MDNSPFLQLTKWNATRTGFVDPVTGKLSSAQSSLAPTGNDDALLLQEFILDGGGIVLPGDMIIGTSVTLKPGSFIPINYGGANRVSAGLNFGGSGPANTRIRLTPGVTLRISPAMPLAGDAAVLLYPTIKDMEFLACDAGGVQLPPGTNAGSAIEFRTDNPGSGAAYEQVSQMLRLENLIFDNFVNDISLDDVTYAEIVRCNFLRLGVAIRLGYNVDNLVIRQSQFGSHLVGHQAGSALQTNWTFTGQPFAPSTGAASVLKIDETDFTHLDLPFDIQTVGGAAMVGQMLLSGTYTESCKQILRVQGNAATQFRLKLMCHYHTNGYSTGYVAGDHTYAALDFSDSNIQPIISMEQCEADTTLVDAWIIHNNSAAVVNWGPNNKITPNPSYGHIFSPMASYGGAITLPNRGNLQCVIGSANNAVGAGLTRMDNGGEQRRATYSPTNGSTVTLDHRTGDRHIITVPNAGTAITVGFADFTAGAADGARQTVEIVAPNTVTAATVVTWAPAHATGQTATITAASTQAVSNITIAAPGVVTVASTAGLQIGSPIVFSGAGTLPTGITAGTRYYVATNNFTGTTFSIASYAGGSGITTTGSFVAPINVSNVGSAIFEFENVNTNSGWIQRNVNPATWI